MKSFCIRIFDDAGEGFITVYRFREILKEIDEEITEEELEGIIGDVRKYFWNHELNLYALNFQIDLDHSNTIDFDEFVKVMT